MAQSNFEKISSLDANETECTTAQGPELQNQADRTYASINESPTRRTSNIINIENQRVSKVLVKNSDDLAISQVMSP